MSFYNSWQIQEAKSRFSELVEVALTKGPQVITKRGEKVAVIMGFEEFQRLKNLNAGLIDKIQSAPKVDLSLREGSP